MASSPAEPVSTDYAGGDRQIWLVVVVALCVLVPRSISITRAQSERYDDEYHLVRGAEYLNGRLAQRADLPLNDPPLGEAMTALPLWVAGCWRGAGPVTRAFYGQKFSADAILNWTGVWKSLLFVPGLALAFLWVRQLYGLKAAWLGVGMVLADANFAGHLPLPTLDVIGVEAIVAGCYFSWRYFRRPTRWRLVVAGVFIGIALMIKHTAILVPVMFVLYGGMWFWRQRDRSKEAIFRLIASTVVCGAIAMITIWAFCGFDFARPRAPEHLAEFRPGLVALTQHRMPAALYVSSFLEGMTHADAGQRGFLFGEKRKSGWWYYFPVVSSYKIPLPLLAMMGLAGISFFWRGFAWEEWSLFLPLIGWSLLMFDTKLNIGFRHFLPAYLFMLLIASRVAIVGAGWMWIGWTLTAAAAIHGLSFHPDYLSYLNFPREHAYLDISDSNIDWGQGLKAARGWIDAHPNRLIFVRDFGWGPQRLTIVRERIGSGAHVLDRGDPLPREGVLIISAVPLAGVYERSDPFRVLREHVPDAVLGHCMMVYDLDKLRGNGAFHWPAYKTFSGDDNPARPSDLNTPTNAHPQG